MKFFDLTKKEYKKYTKMFKKTYVGEKLFSIFETFFAFAMLNLGASLIFEVFLEKEPSRFGTIIFWTMCISMLVSYYNYFKYLKEFIEKNDK